MGQRGEGGTGVVSLAVDVGNTTSSFGLFAASAGETDEPLGTCELTTPQSLTVDEACLQLGSVLELLGGGEGLCGGVAERSWGVRPPAVAWAGLSLCRVPVRLPPGRASRRSSPAWFPL